MNEKHPLKRHSFDDLDDENLHDTARFLNLWPAPQPTAAQTAQLIEHLLPEMPRRSRLREAWEWWPLLLMRAQFRVLRHEIWAASALVIALGVVVTFGSYQSGSLTPLAALAPVVAALGVALLYDGDLVLVFELEDSTPASVRLLLLTRLTLVFGFNLVLALAGSVLLAAVRADVLLWPLVLSWLAPMAFLSALAFWLSIVTGDSVAGMVFSLLIWGMHVVLRSTPITNPILSVLSLPGLGDAAMRPMLIGVALLLLLVAFWMVGRIERRIGDAV